MKKIKIILVTAIIIGLGFMGFFSFYTGPSSTLNNTPPPFTEDQIKRGEYLAQAGDCIACHTATDGKKFAGGLGIASPIGMIYSSNITPDKETGIGSFSLQDFDNAIRYGIRHDGMSLYPAMPFPSYARLSDEDLTNLYAYFMHSVEPVTQANKKNGITWPLSMRWPLTAWRLMFAPDVKSFTAASHQDPIVARGAYLVEGLGHCGTCHTPRSFTLNEKAYSNQESNLFLSGSNAPIDGWMAINLRGDHKDGLGSFTEEELVEFLKTGRTDRTAAFGGMTDAIEHSLQYLTDEDLTAIARYLKTLPALRANNPPFVYDDSVATALYNGDTSKVGAQTYVDNCAACHRTTGKGYPKVFPALAGNPVVQSDNPTSVINIVLKGHTLSGTKAAPTAYTMPTLNWRLSDQELADVATFIRTSWGNQGSIVQSNEVAKLRKALPKNGTE
ncbi:c-type cytochrome [Neisseria sp. Ec49-e6-T10]|uniref:c-type cytochrome n=1 Tax=Neisseria sp. Ec49-e6-T10 TaxID=3140744 RepID=UPI003EBF0294